MLNYDLAIRKLAARHVLYDGDDFKTALDKALNNLSCRERYFITPTAMLAATSNSKAPGAGQSNQDAGKGVKGVRNKVLKQKGKGSAGKGGGKGGKVKGATKGSGTPRITTPIKKTPDGRLICGYYNTANGCVLGADCKFVHICSICFGTDHTSLTCTVTTRV